MKRMMYAATAALAIAMATPAAASITFDLSNVVLTTAGGAPAGTLTGSFTTNDARSAIVAYNIRASASGSFAGYTYTPATSVVTASVLPGQFFQLDDAASANELRLFFSSPLTASGAALNSALSYEFEVSGGLRTASGAVVAQVGSVPEPAVWSMMILGVGAIGFGMRRAVRRSEVKFDARIRRIAAGEEA